MTPEPREYPPLPFRRLILMPWRWNRWTKIGLSVLGLLMPLIYLTSMPLMIVVLWHLDSPAIGFRIYNFVYFPVFWLFPSGPRRDFLVWYHNLIYWLVGFDLQVQ